MNYLHTAAYPITELNLYYGQQYTVAKHLEQVPVLFYTNFTHAIRIQMAQNNEDVACFEDLNVTPAAWNFIIKI